MTALPLALFVLGGAVSAVGLTLALGFDAVPDPALYTEQCRHCNPDEGAEKNHCVGCRPQLGLNYPPER